MKKSFGFGFHVYEAILEGIGVIIFNPNNNQMVEVYNTQHWEEWTEKRVGGYVSKHDAAAKLRVIDKAIEIFLVDYMPPQVEFISYQSLFDLLAKYKNSEIDLFQDSIGKKRYENLRAEMHSWRKWALRDWRNHEMLQARAKRVGKLSIKPEQLTEDELHEYVVLTRMFAASDFYSEVDLSVPHPVDESKGDLYEESLLDESKNG